MGKDNNNNNNKSTEKNKASNDGGKDLFRDTPVRFLGNKSLHYKQILVPSSPNTFLQPFHLSGFCVLPPVRWIAIFNFT